MCMSLIAADSLVALTPCRVELCLHIIAEASLFDPCLSLLLRLSSTSFITLLLCIYTNVLCSEIMSSFQGHPVDYLASEWAQRRSVQWMNRHTSISPGIAHIITPFSLCSSLWQILTLFLSDWMLSSWEAILGFTSQQCSYSLSANYSKRGRYRFTFLGNLK